jgi:hypothetical protein
VGREACDICEVSNIDGVARKGAFDEGSPWW